MEKINIISQKGLATLKEELKELVNVKRPEIIKQIQEAREQGDLSENADYDAAKNEQARIEKRIKELEETLNNIKIVEESKVRTGNIVEFGSTILYKEFPKGEKYKITICGSIEADPSRNLVSNESPLAKAIIGRKVGEVVEIRGIDNPYKIEIINIEK